MKAPQYRKVNIFQALFLRYSKKIEILRKKIEILRNDLKRKEKKITLQLL